jgi:hypothetical protein
MRCRIDKGHAQQAAQADRSIAWLSSLSDIFISDVARSRRLISSVMVNRESVNFNVGREEAHPILPANCPVDIGMVRGVEIVSANPSFQNIVRSI